MAHLHMPTFFHENNLCWSVQSFSFFIRFEIANCSDDDKSMKMFRDEFCREDVSNFAWRINVWRQSSPISKFFPMQIAAAANNVQWFHKVWSQPPIFFLKSIQRPNEFICMSLSRFQKDVYDLINTIVWKYHNFSIIDFTWNQFLGF